jgi:pimeloyl-ACP methyl ester carboxylesterase
MASDVTELATHLGFESSRVAGEDWGAAVAYAVAAFYRSRVVQLVFQEMLLPGPVVPGDEVQLHSRRRLVVTRTQVVGDSRWQAGRADRNPKAHRPSRRSSMDR